MHPWGFGFKLVVTPSSCGTEWGGFGLLWERADLLREGSLNGRSLGVSKGQSSIPPGARASEGTAPGMSAV